MNQVKEIRSIHKDLPKEPKTKYHPIQDIIRDISKEVTT